MASARPAGEGASNEDQRGIKWSDPAWPVGCLNRFSVLAYFECSPFFDAASLNRTARARGLDPAVPGVLESVGTGLEYVVELFQEPNLFVIRKQLRSAGAATSTSSGGGAGGAGGGGGGGADSRPALAYYYVVDNEVYQAPTLHAALTCRIRRCLWGLQQGFGKLQTDLDPLRKALKDHKPAAIAPAAAQLAAASGAASAAASTADGVAGAGAVATAAAGGASEAAAGGSTAGPAAEPAAVRRLVPVVRALDEAAKARWSKTDRIIAHVVNKYPVPMLPAMVVKPPPRAAAAPRAATPQPSVGAAAAPHGDLAVPGGPPPQQPTMSVQASYGVMPAGAAPPAAAAAEASVGVGQGLKRGRR